MRPSVGLLNIGVEEMKGHEEIREAAEQLRAANLPVPIRRELFARLRIHRRPGSRNLLRRIRLNGAVIGGSEQHQCLILFRMLRRIAARARTA